MTARVRHLTVILEHDTREDDVEVVVNAIRMIKRVASVETHEVSAGDAIARRVVRTELRRKLYQAIDDALDGKGG